MKVGITGGIGSGKSYVCQLLKERGIKVYDCDQAAKRIIRSSEDVRSQLLRLIGSLEKADIARFLLENETNAKKIDAIVHPAVFRDFKESGYQWMESAILYESGISSLVRKPSSGYNVNGHKKNYAVVQTMRLLTMAIQISTNN